MRTLQIQHSIAAWISDRDILKRTPALCPMQGEAFRRGVEERIVTRGPRWPGAAIPLGGVEPSPARRQACRGPIRAWVRLQAPEGWHCGEGHRGVPGLPAGRAAVALAKVYGGFPGRFNGGLPARKTACLANTFPGFRTLTTPVRCEACSIRQGSVTAHGARESRKIFNRNSGTSLHYQY